MARRSLVSMGFVKNEVNLSVIAQKLGISTSTVSRALRNLPSIHPTTREHVFEAARAMGYIREGKGGADTESYSILVLSQVADVAHDGPYFAGLSRAAASKNVTLVSHHFLPEECENILKSEFQPQALKSGEIKGIILLHRWPEKVVQELSKNYPIVSVMHGYHPAPIDYVGVDERAGMSDLVRHLMATGHERIGFLGFCREMSWARSRYAAYIESMAEHDLRFDQKDVVKVTLEEAMAETVIQSFKPAAQALQGANSGVKAWICASSNLGHSLALAAVSKGVEIPKDLAITGFHSQKNHNLYKLYGLPTLTSTISSSEEIAATAVRRLMARIEHAEESWRSVLLPCSFYQGETTATPPSEE